MLKKKSWDEFRQTGLFMLVNTILHVFGWTLTVAVDEETGMVTDCFPCRTSYRGFSEEDTTEMYKRIGVYIKEKAEQIESETHL